MIQPVRLREKDQIDSGELAIATPQSQDLLRFLRRESTMQSPFEPPTTNCSSEKRMRNVLIYIVAATVVIPIAVSLAFPGLVLLNQEFEWIQTSGRIYNIEIDGKEVPLKVAMRDSLLVGAAVGLSGLVLALRGIINWRLNSRVSRSPIKPTGISAE